MPELPEVETVRVILKPRIVGKTITKIDVLVPRIISVKGSVDEFTSTLTNETFLDLTRIGKYLIFHLSNELILISHLRMEGKYFMLKEADQLPSHPCVIFTLNSGERLVYNDTRKFGTMEIATSSTYLNTDSLKVLGKEPWDLSPLELKKLSCNSSRAVKNILLDQSIIAGLGNIYVDEVLFKANLHPETPATMLVDSDFVNLIDQSIATLEEAIKAGGTTVRSYQAAPGISGLFQQQLYAYGRAKEPCLICKSKLKKIRVGGRGTTYCPKCQKPRHRALSIGITGVSGSGKSFMLEYLNEQGFGVISADEIVHNLYKKDEVKAKLKQIFGEQIITNNEVDLKSLREQIISDNKLKKELENFIHPLVKKELIKFRDDSKEAVVFMEIPLLYEARFEDITDYVIGITIDESVQIERLISRGQDPKTYLQLNKDNKFKKNRARVDYLIDNSTTLKHFKSEINAAIKSILS